MKRFYILVIAAIIIILFTGCGSQNSTPEQTVQATFEALTNGNEKALAKVYINDFNRLSPIEMIQRANEWGIVGDEVGR